MTDDQRDKLRKVQARQREAHERLFALQGATIDALVDAVQAVKRTQDEMVQLFQGDNDADDLLGE